MDPSLHTTDSDDALLHFCWRSQSCKACLSSASFCSWCPLSGTCISNPASLPLLTPIYNLPAFYHSNGSASICPLGHREDWELRARPLGCNVSTLTFATGVACVLGTLGVVLFGVVVWRALGWVRRARFRRRRRSIARFPGALDGGRDGEEGSLVVRWRDTRGRGQGQRRVLDERSPLLDEEL